MRVEDDDHLTRRMKRPALGQRDHLAQVADGDRSPAAAHDVQIGVGAGQGRPAGRTLPAPALGAQERRGEPVGRREPPVPGRAPEEVGMHGMGRGGAEGRHRRVL